MEVAIITDTHFGVRNDNVAFMDMTKKFLDNVFFPEIIIKSLAIMIPTIKIQMSQMPQKSSIAIYFLYTNAQLILKSAVLKSF